MRISMVVMLAALVSCGSHEQTDQEKPNLEGFESFYHKFHRDSAFQMGHITFPLEGLPPMGDTISDRSAFRWQREQWVLHRDLSDELSGYDRDRTIFGEDIIVETIIQKDTDVGMERRFAKMDGDWMLIYYAAMNPVKGKVQ